MIGLNLGVDGVVVDGNNVIDIWQVAETVILKARSGEGPTLIEARTYRQRGLEVTFSQKIIERKRMLKSGKIKIL